MQKWHLGGATSNSRSDGNAQGLILLGKINPEIRWAQINVGAQSGKSDWSRDLELGARLVTNEKSLNCNNFFQI